MPCKRSAYSFSHTVAYVLHIFQQRLPTRGKKKKCLKPFEIFVVFSLPIFHWKIIRWNLSREHNCLTASASSIELKFEWFFNRNLFLLKKHSFGFIPSNSLVFISHKRYRKLNRRELTIALWRWYVTLFIAVD